MVTILKGREQMAAIGFPSCCSSYNANIYGNLADQLEFFFDDLPVRPKTNDKSCDNMSTTAYYHKKRSL